MVGVVTNVVTWRSVGERKTANSLRISGLWWCHQYWGLLIKGVIIS